MTNLVMLADHRKLHEYWQEYNREFGSDTDYQDWLEYLLLHRTELLKQAEERAAHHAEIASVCSATAERYAMALDSIIDAASILDFVASSNSVQIKHALGFARSKARLARKEAE